MCNKVLQCECPSPSIHVAGLYLSLIFRTPSTASKYSSFWEWCPRLLPRWTWLPHFIIRSWLKRLVPFVICSPESMAVEHHHSPISFCLNLLASSSFIRSPSIWRVHRFGSWIQTGRLFSLFFLGNDYFLISLHESSFCKRETQRFWHEYKLSSE